MADKRAKDTRAYISDRFVLELDSGSSGSKSKCVGTLQSVEGGGMKSDMVEEKVGVDGLVTRYPGRPKYDDISIQVGMAMAPSFWEWINKSFTYNAERRNGAIVALDFDNKERWRRNFSAALITEVSFPQLDAAGKEPAYMTVKFAVESTTYEKSSAKYPAEQEALNEWKKQHLWLPSNFTFKLDQFNGGNQVNAKIDSFAVKQNVIEHKVGHLLESTKHPGRVEFPQIKVTILERDADPWLEWYKEMVRKGDHRQTNEKTGHISYLPRNTREAPLVTLNIFGMGILGINPVKHDSKQQQIQKITVDLYCQSMALTPGAGTV